MAMTDVLVYFPHTGDIEWANGNKRICTAIQCGHNGETRSLQIFQQETVILVANIPHATSMADALLGMKWMTISEAIGYGIDLDDPDQDLTLLA